MTNALADRLIIPITQETQPQDSSRCIRWLRRILWQVVKDPRSHLDDALDDLPPRPSENRHCDTPHKQRYLMETLDARINCRLDVKAVPTIDESVGVRPAQRIGPCCFR
jgi:hypothetical protein